MSTQHASFYCAEIGKLKLRLTALINHRWSPQSVWWRREYLKMSQTIGVYKMKAGRFDKRRPRVL